MASINASLVLLVEFQYEIMSLVVNATDTNAVLSPLYSNPESTAWHPV